MPLVSDTAICLRRFEYSETSQVLTLLARKHGLMRLLAKGAHRRTKAGASKFDGGLDLLEVGQAVFTDSDSKDLNALTEWKLLEGHLELRKSLRAMNLALFAGELVVHLLEERDPHESLFERLQQALIDIGSKAIEETFLALLLDILRLSGHLPELMQCVNCQRSIGERDGVYFSNQSDGIICRNCEMTAPDRVAIDIRLLRIVQLIQALPRVDGRVQRLPRLTRHQTDPLNRLLARYIEQSIGKRLAMTGLILSRDGPK